MKTIWFLVAMAVIAGTPGMALTDVADDKARIMAASRAFSNAYLRGDTTTLKNLYTEDAVLLPTGSSYSGRAAIASYFAPIEGRTNASHEFRVEKLTIEGDIAIDMGTWHYAWRVGKVTYSADERYLVIWRRCEDGVWRIQYDMWHRPQS